MTRQLRSPGSRHYLVTCNGSLVQGALTLNLQLVFAITSANLNNSQNQIITQPFRREVDLMSEQVERPLLPRLPFQT
jgi:hypothetical protein